MFKFPFGAVASVAIEKLQRGERKVLQDVLAVEEPLEIRLDFLDPRGSKRQQKSISITMRTPGHDFELALGFLLTESVLKNRRDVLDVSYCGPKVPKLGHSNLVKVRLVEHARFDLHKPAQPKLARAVTRCIGDRQPGTDRIHIYNSSTLLLFKIRQHRVTAVNVA